MAKRDGAVQRAITRAHRAAVIAGFDEPFAVAVWPAAYDADMMRPYHHCADLRSAGTGADARPVARQIEPRIGHAEHVAHIGAAPGATVAGIMPAVHGCIR